MKGSGEGEIAMAILAIALRADATRRPKSLPAILSNSGEFVHAPCPARKIAAPGRGLNFSSGGEGEIRTHEPRKGPPVFKTGAFNRSATSPFRGLGAGGAILPDNKPRVRPPKPLNRRHLPLYWLEPG